MPEVVITRLLALAAAVAALAGAAVQAKGPFPVDRVPAAIPAGGVNVTGVLVLLPPTSMNGVISSSRAIISSSRAMRLAAKNADPGVWQFARTQLAVIRGPVTVAPDGQHSSWATLRDEPAWIVTYTASRPQHVGFGPGEAKGVKHMSVVLDARDGRYVRGIYTS
jgi:hypothetical protein